MTRVTLCRVVHHGMRIGLAALFLWAGCGKLSDIPDFADRLAAFGIVPDIFVVPVAVVIAFSEVLVGVASACNVRWALGATFLMLVLFISVLCYGIALGLDVECGCFGPGYRLALKTQLLVDLGLVLWCGLVYGSQQLCGIRTAGPLR